MRQEQPPICGRCGQENPGNYCSGCGARQRGPQIPWGSTQFPWKPVLAVLAAAPSPNRRRTHTPTTGRRTSRPVSRRPAHPGASPFGHRGHQPRSRRAGGRPKQRVHNHVHNHGDGPRDRRAPNSSEGRDERSPPMKSVPRGTTYLGHGTQLNGQPSVTTEDKKTLLKLLFEYSNREDSYRLLILAEDLEAAITRSTLPLRNCTPTRRLHRKGQGIPHTLRRIRLLASPSSA